MPYKDKETAAIYSKEWHAKNKEAVAIKSKEYAAKNPHMRREAGWKRLGIPGMTMKKYNDMFLEQEGACKICARHQSVLKNALAVDHDHKTGKIRGLLCGECNTGIGLLQDDISLLETAIAYLRNHNE